MARCVAVCFVFVGLVLFTGHAYASYNVILQSVYGSHSIPVLKLAKALSDQGMMVSFVGLHGAKALATKVLGTDRFAFEICEAGPSHFQNFKYDPETTDEQLLQVAHAVYDDFFIPESTNIFNYLRLHVFGRNASSPASEKSCNKGQMPDALVSDFVSLAGFMIAKDFPRLPHIVNNPHGIMDLHNIPLWFPIMHLAQDPSHLSVGGVAMNVLGSFLGDLLVFNSVAAKMNALRADHGLPPMTTREVFGSKSILTLANTVIGLEFPRNFHPRSQFVGPLVENSPPLNCSKSTALEQHGSLCNWFEAQVKEGRSIIFISFGTLFTPTQRAVGEVFKAMEEVSRDPNSRTSVLWVVPERHRDKLPVDAVFQQSFNSSVQNEHFLFQGWVPQPEVLAHPSVKLHVSHCGMGGVTESLIEEKPLLCVPVWADQPGAAARVAAAGAGLFLLNHKLAQSDVKRDITRILTEESFARNASRMARLFKFAGGPKRAADVIRLLLETGGQGEHLKDIMETAPVLKYQIITVGVLAAPFLLLFGLLWFLIKVCCGFANSTTRYGVPSVKSKPE